MNQGGRLLQHLRHRQPRPLCTLGRRFWRHCVRASHPSQTSCAAKCQPSLARTLARSLSLVPGERISSSGSNINNCFPCSPLSQFVRLVLGSVVAHSGWQVFISLSSAPLKSRHTDYKVDVTSHINKFQDIARKSNHLF